MTAPGGGIDGAGPTVAERWRRVPRRWRIVLVLLGALVAGELASSLLDGLGSSGSGASGPSSAFDSSPVGTEAFAQLLRVRGADVVRETVPLAAANLPPGATLFVLDPASWSRADTTAVSRALGDGHRVVLGGEPPSEDLLRSLLGTVAPPVWRPAVVGVAHPASRAPEVRGVATVVAPAPGAYTDGGATLRPLLTGPGGEVALVAARLPLVLLASASPLQNQALGEADNAAFGLDLAGSGPVAFDEYDHGFGHPGTGLAGLPLRWKWGLALAAVALGVWVLSAARRFGPPASSERALVPPRAEYVDAMATLLASRPATSLSGILEPLREEARRALFERAGLPPHTPLTALGPDDIERLGRRAGDPAALAVLSREPASAGDVVALGRLAASLARARNGPEAVG